MGDFAGLAVQTCRDHLTVAQLRALCRARGWSPRAAGKEALVAFVAPRLLEPTGAAAAMAALGEVWRRVLHGIAMETGSVELDALLPFLGASRRMLRGSPRSLLRAVADGLLVAGVVLVEEKGTRVVRGRSDPDIFLHLPAVHRAALPPYPVETVPLGERPELGDGEGFGRAVLLTALRGPGSAPAGGLAARAAAAVEVGEGPVRLGKTEMLDLTGFLDRLRRIWCDEGGKKAARARRAAFHVLGHLPPESGVTSEGLGRALEAVGCALPGADLDRFLEDGVGAGFLARGGEPRRPCFRAAGARVTGAGGGDLAFRPTEGGVLVDLRGTALDPLFSLAAVCTAKRATGGLLLSPHPVLLGRSADRFAAVSGLAAVRAASPPFEVAAARAERRAGKLRLHRGLLVVKVQDEGLEALLADRLGDDVRRISAAHLAVPPTRFGRLEALVTREGYALRFAK